LNQLARKRRRAPIRSKIDRGDCRGDAEIAERAIAAGERPVREAVRVRRVLAGFSAEDAGAPGG
jgi:hypothetical protein